MKGETKITKIKITVAGKELELTLEEAKELKEVLVDLFPEKEVINIPQPYPVYPQPQEPWAKDYWLEPIIYEDFPQILCLSTIK